MGEARMHPDTVDVARLAKELAEAEPVRSQIPAFEAFTLLGALQFAWRHPGLSELHRSIVEKAARDLQEALARRSAYVGQVAELGWQREHDVPPPAPLEGWPFASVIHHLHHGVTACGQMKGLPSEWPAMHRWAAEWHHVSCRGCLIAGGRLTAEKS